MSRARRCHIIPEIEGNSRRGNAIEPGKELTLILESETERVTQMVGELLEITFSDAVINIYSATCTLLALSLSLSLFLSSFEKARIVSVATRHRIIPVMLPRTSRIFRENAESGGRCSRPELSNRTKNRIMRTGCYNGETEIAVRDFHLLHSRLAACRGNGNGALRIQIHPCLTYIDVIFHIYRCTRT